MTGELPFNGWVVASTHVCPPEALHVPDPLVAKRNSNRAGSSDPRENHQIFRPCNLIHSPIMNSEVKVTPGYGQPHPKCGTISSRSIRATVVCPDNPEHYKRVIFDGCHRPECPVDWPSWAGRGAERIADTVTGFKTAHGYQYYPDHIDITPALACVPFDKPSPECLQWLLEEINSRLDVLGVVAASVVPHPYRIRPYRKKEVNDGASADHENRYVWALKQENWSDYVYFSPHVHALVYGKLIHVLDFERLTGWQYHKHGRKLDGKTRYGLRTREYVVKVAYYLLTHAWVRGNNKVVRNLRGMSSTKLLVTQVKVDTPDTCPKCGAHAVRIPYYSDSAGNQIIYYQDLHKCDKAYKVVVTRTVSAKVSAAALLEIAWQGSQRWAKRYNRDHAPYFYIPSLVPA